MNGTTFYTPVFLSLFFLFGYVLSLADIAYHYEGYASNVWYGGAFVNFWAARDAMTNLLTIIIAGAAGIMLSTLWVSAFFKVDIQRRSVGIVPCKIRLQTLVSLWAVMAVCLQVSLVWFGLGRTGMVNRTELPLALSGILIISGRLAVPMVALFLLRIAVMQKRSKVVTLIMILATLEAITASFVATSRGLFVVHLMPLLFYLLVHPDVDPKIRHTSRMYGVVGVLCLAVVVGVVEVVREVSYAIGDIEPLAVLSTIYAGELTVDLSRSLSMVVSLATGRVGGILELMAVYASPIHNWELFYGTLTGLPSLDINDIVLGLVLPEGLNLGVGFGLFGSLYLSGSVWVVFVGSFLFTSVALGVEGFARKLALDSVSCGLSLILALNIWGYWYWLRMWKELLVIFTVLFLLAWLAKTRSGLCWIQVMPRRPAPDWPQLSHGLAKETLNE
jgi:hypothetical protein